MLSWYSANELARLMGPDMLGVVLALGIMLVLVMLAMEICRAGVARQYGAVARGVLAALMLVLSGVGILLGSALGQADSLREIVSGTHPYTIEMFGGRVYVERPAVEVVDDSGRVVGVAARKASFVMRDLGRIEVLIDDEFPAARDAWRRAWASSQMALRQ
jgi:hypothetical protein